MSNRRRNRNNNGKNFLNNDNNIFALLIWFIAGLTVPFIGVYLYYAIRDTQPKSARACMLGAFWPLVLIIVSVIAFIFLAFWN